MNNRKIYTKYMSNIYAGSERILNVEKEYYSTYFWTKKYIVSFLPKSKKCRVLDVGCGLGQNLFALSKLGYSNNVGIDISKECVDFCKDSGFNVLEVSVENYLKDKLSSYDVIISSHLLEHIEKDELVKFIRMLRAGLKKNGTLIINVPNGANAISGVRDRYVDITHEILFTEESLRELLLLAGFKDENILIKELVAYSLDDINFFKKIIKITLLPILTLIVDLVWYIFFVSQGSSIRKNRPVLISISKRS